MRHATTPRTLPRCPANDRKLTHPSHLTHHRPPSPRQDKIVGEVAARSLLIKLGNPALAIDAPAWRQEALMAALLALLASYGREVPPSHQLRGFCRVLQDRLEAAE
ncbi:MAG TPA: hypothetical protein PK359_15300 [Burkholderiaceae bacterium]|nr:hypothetical protein [Burkholderiaceae bacterium]